MKVFFGVGMIACIGIGFISGYLFFRQQNLNSSIETIQKETSFRSKVGKNASLSTVSSNTSGNIIAVRQDESIMDAVKQAESGDTILVYPGTYTETIYIDKDDITLRGVIKEGKRAVLEGEKRLNDAILYSGNNIKVENLKIQNYKGNGIMGQAGNNFEIRNNIITDTGVYGVFPQLGKNGIVEHNIISGIADAAIYVGMSDNIHVAHNEVFDNVAGIEIENTRHAIVENNLVYNNTGGILAFVTPGLPIKTTFDVIIRKNFVNNNNHKNFGAPGSTVAGIPSGTGILIMAADDVIIDRNIISGNKTAGILITDHGHAANITFDPESEPNADSFRILDNQMINNGYDTIDEIKALKAVSLTMGSPDIVRVGESKGSCINNKHRYVTIGLDPYSNCPFTNTDATRSYLLETPVPPRKIDKSAQGKLTYLGVCTGCHYYTGRLIGPPMKDIQEIYRNNPIGLAHYISNPVKKRQNFPEMPPQDYLSKETRLAVAKYVLSLKN